MTTPPPPPPPGADPPQGGARPQQGYRGPPPAGSSTASTQERTWSILAHLSAPAAFLLSAGFLSFLGPLIIWAIYKERSPLVRRASAGSFNFNVTLWLIYVLTWLLVIVTLGLGFLVAVPVWIVLFVVGAVLHIMAAVRASRGEAYVYPLQVPVLR